MSELISGLDHRNSNHIRIIISTEDMTEVALTVEIQSSPMLYTERKAVLEAMHEFVKKFSGNQP